MVSSGATVTAKGSGSDNTASNTYIGESRGVWATDGVTVDGKLTASGSAAARMSCGVYSKSGYVTINSGATVTANGGNAVQGNIFGSYGILAGSDNDEISGGKGDGNVNISGGTVSATGGMSSSNSYGISSNGSVAVSGGVVTAKAGTAGTSIGIYGSTVSVTGTGKVIVSGDNYAVEAGSTLTVTTVTDGNITGKQIKQTDSETPVVIDCDTSVNISFNPCNGGTGTKVKKADLSNPLDEPDPWND